MYRSSKIGELSWLLHGFGTAGVSVEDYLSELGVGDFFVPKTNQLHGNVVHILTGKEKGLLEGDAFVTNLSGVACYVRTADCVPILMCDPQKRVVAAVHAGWRGLACNVIGATIARMQSEFGCSAKDIVAAIGPAICKKCYVVKKDVINALTVCHSCESRNPDGFFLDLHGLAFKQLNDAGLENKNVDTISVCTFCGNGGLASYRRDQNTEARQVNFVVLMSRNFNL